MVRRWAQIFLNLCAKYFVCVDVEELLGELQMCFVCFLVGHGMCVRVTWRGRLVRG